MGVKREELDVRRITNRVILLPNGLSLLRLSLTSVLVMQILRDGSMILPFYCVLSLSDILDGALARKLHATSNIGRYLDVVADFTLLFSISSVYMVQGLYHPLLLAAELTSFSLFLLRGG